LVVADVSDYLGTDKEVAFAFDALRYRMSDQEVRLVADIAREDLEKAPAFTSLADAAELNDMQGIAADDNIPQRVDEPQPRLLFAEGGSDSGPDDGRGVGVFRTFPGAWSRASAAQPPPGA
jgi:hypothetical protein